MNKKFPSTYVWCDSFLSLAHIKISVKMSSAITKMVSKVPVSMVPVQTYKFSKPIKPCAGM